MFRTVGNILALIALIFLCGMHFAVLQLAANLRMVAIYSEGQTLARAVADTVGGQRPCSLCKKIRKGQAEEKKKAIAISYAEKKAEAILLMSSFVPTPTQQETLTFADFLAASASRHDAPSLRPPRLA